MRRILALAAVSGLALTGLIGTPAAAEVTPLQTPRVMLSEVAADLTEGVQVGIDYVEVMNLETTSTDIDGWEIRACAADGTATVTSIVSTGSPGRTVIPAEWFHLTANSNYNLSSFTPARDIALVGSLDPDGGVALIDDSSTAVHAVTFDVSNSAVSTCLAFSSPEVSNSPTTALSATRDFSTGLWSLAGASPESTTS